MAQISIPKRVPSQTGGKPRIINSIQQRIAQMDPELMASFISGITKILAPPGGKFKINIYFLPFAALRLIFQIKVVYEVQIRIKFCIGGGHLDICYFVGGLDKVFKF